MGIVVDMIETRQNLFDNIDNLDCLVCTINQVVKKDGLLVMGAGIAKVFSEKYKGNKESPSLARVWGDRTKFKKSGILITPIFHTDCTTKYLCGLPTKYHWKENSDIDLIVKSCKELLIVANAFGWQKIGMTKPGCGHGNLDWDYVKNKINFLDERFIIHV